MKNLPITTTATLKAWTANEWDNIDRVADLTAAGEPDRALGAMVYTNHDMTSQEGWTEVGTAEITVTFHPREDLQAKELAGLHAQLQKVRAENQQRENYILDRISQLQAIEYVEAAA